MAAADVTCVVRGTSTVKKALCQVGSWSAQPAAKRPPGCRLVPSVNAWPHLPSSSSLLGATAALPPTPGELSGAVPDEAC